MHKRHDPFNVTDIENKVRVNNTVVDIELGAKEVAVLQTWNKMCSGLRNVSTKQVTAYKRSSP